MYTAELIPDERYDVVVIGAGPGGAVAARETARRGLSTLLLERRREIGIPLACAEAVRRAGFDELTAMDPSWIAASIHGGRLITPDGTAVVLSRPDAGVVLERPLFERHLATEAAAAGAEVLVDRPVAELLSEHGRTTGVVVRARGRSWPVRAQVVIAADGVESRFAIATGLARPLARDEFYSCAQFLLTGPVGQWDLLDGVADFAIGNRIAPGGYGWRIPKGGGRWNVGLAVSPAVLGAGTGSSTSPTALLRRFVARTLPGARILGYLTGAIPCPPSPGPFAGGGLVLVGDAARLTEPLSGAGIAIAMESGVFAAEAVAEAIGRGDPSPRGLRLYEERWRDERGAEVGFYAKARTLFRRLGDHDLDRVGRALAGVLEEHDPREPVTARGIGRSLVTADPRLLLLGRHLLAA